MHAIVNLFFRGLLVTGVVMVILSRPLSQRQGRTCVIHLLKLYEITRSINSAIGLDGSPLLAFFAIPLHTPWWREALYVRINCLSQELNSLNSSSARFGVQVAYH